MNKRILIFIALCAVTLVAFAQDGLKVDRFFNEPFISSKGVTYITATGEQLKSWKGQITEYRSLQVSGDDDLIKSIENAVKADGAKSETRTVYMSDGHIAYGLYVLPPRDGVNRYLVITTNVDKTTGKTTTNVFYIEGHVSPDNFDSILRS
ncbi:MAG: hypothetical protein K2N28_05620 [Muribaculaceae bacterium]|nr:hypothetical protein [Muribaculaceae bacterium]